MKLADLVVEYVSLKQAIGMRFRSRAKIFRSFCRAVRDIDVEKVDVPSMEVFLTGKDPIKASWHRNYSALNCLFRFAVNRGYIKVAPLPRTIPKRSDPQPPYIYTTEELGRLIAATDSLNPRTSPLQPATFRTLLLTLYGTGLRISEALSLTLADVNLGDSLVIVRDSKFFKSRLVPTGPRLTWHLQAYFEKQRWLPRPSGEDSAFFVTRTGHALACGYVSKVFRVLVRRAEIPRRADTYFGPRIHDLRHTAVVHRLETWYREGADVAHGILEGAMSSQGGHLLMLRL